MLALVLVAMPGFACQGHHKVSVGPVVVGTQHRVDTSPLLSGDARIISHEVDLVADQLFEPGLGLMSSEIQRH